MTVERPQRRRRHAVPRQPRPVSRALPAVAVLAVLLLAACGGSDNNAPADTTVADTSCLSSTDPDAEAPVASDANARITIINDDATLDALVTCSDTAVEVGATTQGAQPQRVGRGFSLRLVSEAAPPNIVGAAVYAGAPGTKDDATAGGTYTPVLSDPPYQRYIVEIDGEGAPDTFRWSDDDRATYTEGVAITGVEQALSNGVTITFASTTGHSAGTSWRIDAGTLQATTVAISNNTAVVGYAMAGPPSLGALRVYSLRRGTARLKSQALFRDTDINAVAIEASTVYAVGASTTTTTVPAVVESLGLVRSRLQLGGARAELHSFAGTGAIYDATRGQLYVSDGNAGGLSTLHPSTLAGTDYIALDDARGVGLEGDVLAVVQGCCGTATDGQLTVYDVSGSTPALPQVFPFTGADIAESKSTVEVLGAKAFVGAGSGGAQVLSTTDGTVLASVPVPTGTGLAPDVIVANAVSAHEDLMFISFGEAGVYVAQETTDNFDATGAAGPVSLDLLGQLQFGALESVNHVAYSGRYLIVAAGLGGLKIVNVRL